MDPGYKQQELNKRAVDFFQETKPFMTQQQQKLVNKIMEVTQKCEKKYGNDENKFVNCMFETEERNQKVMQQMEYKLMHWRNKTLECFENDQSNPDKCERNAMQKLEKHIDSTLQAL
ncbi:hypothetical protein PPERSA_09017 [Pseudocohnilembus persalinus]|uniref:Uncharacterized protein n=1 Tax=Pseudocohnilembus persalinus TaxID=266149 RepID=A0A0V0R352_PSEPJ|nr:hypothetical protein PPERSA_09017 [Pseudocohnilembus persalinus]|eukprot:KRX08913.1 hypothetical protein PPERSA_09017 [Pseudocohnilembus persalinus]